MRSQPLPEAAARARSAFSCQAIRHPRADVFVPAVQLSSAIEHSMSSSKLSPRLTWNRDWTSRDLGPLAVRVISLAMIEGAARRHTRQPRRMTCSSWPVMVERRTRRSDCWRPGNDDVDSTPPGPPRPIARSAAGRAENRASRSRCAAGRPRFAAHDFMYGFGGKMGSRPSTRHTRAVDLPVGPGRFPNCHASPERFTRRGRPTSSAKTASSCSTTGPRTQKCMSRSTAAPANSLLNRS